MSWSCHCQWCHVMVLQCVFWNFKNKFEFCVTISWEGWLKVCVCPIAPEVRQLLVSMPWGLPNFIWIECLYCFISLQICNTIAKPSQFRLDMKRTRTCVRSLTCQIREQLTSCVLQMFLAWLDLTWLLPWLDLTFAIFHGVQLWTLNIINKGLTITFNTYAFKPYFSSKSAHPPDSYPPGTLILFDSVTDEARAVRAKNIARERTQTCHVDPFMLDQTPLALFAKRYNLPVRRGLDNRLRVFSDSPDTMPPISCLLHGCEKCFFTNLSEFVAHCDAEHEGYHTYRLRVLHLMTQQVWQFPGSLQRAALQNFAEFQVRGATDWDGFTPAMKEKLSCGQSLQNDGGPVDFWHAWSVLKGAGLRNSFQPSLLVLTLHFRKKTRFVCYWIRICMLQLGRRCHQKKYSNRVQLCTCQQVKRFKCFCTNVVCRRKCVLAKNQLLCAKNAESVWWKIPLRCLHER